jgi:hypothetical protein
MAMAKVLKRTTMVTEEVLDEHDAEALDDVQSEDDVDEPEGEDGEEFESEDPTVGRRRRAR